MRNISFTLVFLVSGLVYSQNIDSLKLKQIYKVIDSIEYSEIDFIKFKKRFTENNGILIKKVGLEGTIELDLLELLELSYKGAKIKYGEQNVKMMIYSYYKSRNILGEFKQIDSTFKAKNNRIEKQKNYSIKKLN